MPNSKNKTVVALDKELVTRFRSLYPRLLSVFLERSINLALQDKNLFEKIFFSPMFMEIK